MKQRQTRDAPHHIHGLSCDQLSATGGTGSPLSLTTLTSHGKGQETTEIQVTAPCATETYTVQKASGLKSWIPCISPLS